MDILFSDTALPIVFAMLTALSLLLYAILDGFDLGVGILLPMSDEGQRDTAIASIGPFWDANETWLVLAVGLLLVAFPAAHSAILKAFYLPATIMLLALILRGVAFDFRAKVKPRRKRIWDYTFKIGSMLTAFTQGFMLGLYVMGLEYTLASVVFSIFSGFCVLAAYSLIGAAWLVMKTSGELQLSAISWSKKCGVLTAFGILVVCLVNPYVNASVLRIWTELPWAYFYAAIPLLCAFMFILGFLVLKRLPLADDAGASLPFYMVVIIFVCCFLGLSFSFYPYVVPGQLTLNEAASSPASLKIILIGSVFVLPFIGAYTVFSYYTFRGKAEQLRYY
ncbi:cytochrome d ubiquinol oxidase subunit II [Glaciecola sp. MH2013]|uniref:cytochrome d ubiquinol oxidase subunit II n=1 Tax=Glaciecola sp. MH2013 TaxID=2785524 RepID=UPI00189FB027|nr:cytochrome d ubiquinol oxidase subunit II [Glaciecola sp. MH2013]MBF7072617.1 cytochrome d ubiquinol oxidase subunit II [Glaciecola sp. MH2013]